MNPGEVALAAAEVVRPAYVVVLDNVMAPHEAVVREVAHGVPLRDLAPATGRFPYVCRYQGCWAARSNMGTLNAPGSVTEFFAYPQGGGDGGSDAGRIILTIAAIYIAVTFAQPQIAAALGPAGLGLSSAQAGSLASFLATTAAGALVNALVPVGAAGSATFNSESPSPTYTVGLSGNQARLDQAIPVLYGRNKVYPDFAAEAYSKFDSNDDQYYYALFCLGQGSYAQESILLDDTSITSFGDVQYRWLEPGEAPTLVAANITSAPEVSGNTLTGARYVGPFTGCRPKSVATQIEIDVTFSRGLAAYNASTGAPENKAVSWRVEFRLVDDFGIPLTSSNGRWQKFPTETLTLAQTEPVRRTYTYTLPVPGRPQVRLVRTTAFDSNSRVANTMEWAALRCVLQGAAPLSVTSTHLELKMRASEQLTGLSQRKIAVISTRKLEIWNGTTWSALTATRNPAWALADKWRNSDYGDGYSDDQIDLDTLLHYSQVWDQRQDRFDGVFDQTYETGQADQMIAQAGRASTFRRNGVMTLTRDERKDTPRLAFTSRVIDPGSVEISYALAHETTPDGVIVEYFDNRVWDWRPITCPLPGVVTPVRAQRLRLFGVTGAKHAEREGRYNAANNYYRRKFPSFSTEMEGMLVTFGSKAAFSPALPGHGRNGDIVDWNPATLQATLSEAPVWVSGATHYLTLIQRNGKPAPAIIVTPGSTVNQVLLASAPTFSPSYSADNEERTKYVFGAGARFDSEIRILSARGAMDATGRTTFSISAVVEDDRVHQADESLLPAQGEVQDPVIPGTDTDPGTGLALIPSLTDREDESNSLFSSGLTVTGYEFRTNGQLYVYRLIGGGTTSSTEANQWLLANPHAATSEFEIRATLLAGNWTYGEAPTGSALSSWLNLNTLRTWQISAVGAGATSSARLLFEIRDVETETVQASAVFRLSASIYDGGV